MTSTGLFLTFEGGEGTGKSTQLELLAGHFEALGREVVRTREPGGTILAEAIRSVLLDPAQCPDGLSELLLLEAARHDHVERVVRPSVARGAIVLSDRFADSSTVYQGHVRGLGPAMVRQLNALATGGFEPDLTLVFDMDPELAVVRARDRNADGDGSQSRLDDEPLAFHRQVREAFLLLAQATPERIRIVDAAGDAETVFRRVLAVVEDVLR